MKTNKNFDIYSILNNSYRKIDIIGRCLLFNLEHIEGDDTINNLPKIADYLLDLRGINYVIVYGVREDAVYILGRGENGGKFEGEFKDAFNGVGLVRVCGKNLLAKFSLDLIGLVNSRSKALNVIKETISDRFSEPWNKKRVIIPEKEVVAG